MAKLIAMFLLNLLVLGQDSSRDLKDQGSKPPTGGESASQTVRHNHYSKASKGSRKPTLGSIPPVDLSPSGFWSRIQAGISFQT
jgi:hypothetical protein